MGQADGILVAHTVETCAILPISFDNAVKSFLEDCESKNKPRTVYDYKRLLNRHFRLGKSQVSEPHLDLAPLEHHLPDIQAKRVILTHLSDDMLSQLDDVPYEAVRGEAAFYGPKVDFQIVNVVGREESASTNQLDLIMAERFDLFYIGADNQKHRPHIIHRAPLGSHERFVAFLIEHYGGVFPTWLAPVQARIIPVASAFAEYAFKLRDTLRGDLVRAEVDDSQESLGKKIRNGATSKIPNLFIVGQKEMDDQAVSWKRHGEKEQVTYGFEKVREMLAGEIAARTDWRNSRR